MNFKEQNFYDKLRSSVPPISFVLSVILFLSYFLTDYHYPFVFGIVYFAISILFPIFDLGKSIAIEIESLQSELSLKVNDNEVLEHRAEQLFKSHEIGLRKFYDQALKQSNVIFITGILCLIFGFSFLGYSFYFIE